LDLALASRRRHKDESLDIWPGFVDALSTVLLVFIFVLVGFISSQIYLSGVILDKDSSLTRLRERILALSSVLSKEQEENKGLRCTNEELVREIESLQASVFLLKSMISEGEDKLKDVENDKQSLEDQIAELNVRLQGILVALRTEEKTSKETKDILEKMKRENIKLSELTKLSAYRSEFFNKLFEIIRDKEGIKVVGDRFVFPSELFFSSASSDLNDEGKEQIREVANVIKEIAEKIPYDINWILRVDGHTDQRPISGRFPSNWELSTARAIAVVKFLVSEGVSANHLVAAGFGENQPIDKRNTEEAFSKNRRIEFKLDER
jgi:chemotaxis protein MotB